MRFVRALHEGNGATPMHELEFRALDGAGARPAGAARLELFVGLIPPDEPVPKHPAYVSALRPWYWRSFTRSPIVLVPPMARVPMRVVYWGRWADTTGNDGPFSSTVAGWVEGGTHHNLPGAIGLSFSGRDRNAAPPLIEDATSTPQQTKYTVAILEAHVQSFAPNLVPSRELSSPEEKQTPQLEGPEEEAA
jgi:hypothetical protein